jgi:type I restriction enzyme M protein
MAVFTPTSASQLQSSFVRFDAEFFRPEFVDVYEKVSAIPGIVFLGSISKRITQGSNPQFAQSGKPCVNGKNVYFGTMLEGEPNFVSSIEFERLSGYTLQRNDIVITLKHATKVGRAWIVEDDEPRIFSRNVGLIRLKQDSPIIPSVVLLYLWTKQGQLLIDRCATGGTTGQITLPMSELRRLPIPPVPEDVQKEIDSLFWKSRSCINQSIYSYTQAQQLLESELGLDNLRFTKPVGYTAQFSELELSRRFDSEHYYPAFDNLKEKLPEHIQLVPLGSLLTSCQRGKQPIYSATGLPVLNSKHILENKITLEGNRYAKPSPDGLQIQDGDALINGTGRGTIGRTAPYLISDHQAIPDNHVTILRSSTLDPAYLSFYLNSLAGKLQVEKYQRGSSGQLELYPFDIRKFQVWEAPISIQQEIRRLYEQATESAKQSRELLEQAKSRVEQLIEEAVGS